MCDSMVVLLKYATINSTISFTFADSFTAISYRNWSVAGSTCWVLHHVLDVDTWTEGEQEYHCLNAPLTLQQWMKVWLTRKSLGFWGTVFAGYWWAFRKRLGLDASIQTHSASCFVRENPYCAFTPHKEESALSTPPKSLLSLLSPFRMFVLAFFFYLKGQRATCAKHHHATTAVAQPIYRHRWSRKVTW